MKLPLSADELSPQWLTHALESGGQLPAAVVAGVRAEPIEVGRGFVGQVHRLHLAYEEAPIGAPNSLIAKLPALDGDARRFNAALWRDRREVRFYRGLATEVPLHVPRCYYAELESEEGSGALLLEDLGAEATNLGYFDDCPPERAVQAIEAIARLHARFWNASRVGGLEWPKDRLEGIYRGSSEMTRQLWGAFESTAPCPIPDAISRNHDRIVMAIARRPERILASDTSLLHGDYWLGNLLFLGDNGPDDVCVLDWQSASWGPVTDDLATFLAMGLSSELRRESGTELLAHYHAELCRHGVEGYPLESMLEDYRASLVAALAIPIISATELASRKEKEAGDPSFEILVRIHDALTVRLLESVIEQDALTSLG
jgi:hypothetical protein